MTRQNPAKRIPKAIGTDQHLFGPFTLSDLAVGLLPGVFVVLGTQLLVPAGLRVAGYRVQLLGVPLAAVAVLVGLLFVSLTPVYTTSIDWLSSFGRFSKSNRRLEHEAAAAHTLIERAHPDLGAIERTDGALIGLVSVDPPSMALATDAEWRRMAEAFQDVCNEVIEFPVQFFSTTQPFPAETYLAHFEARLDDPDVRANPRLADLIEEYLDWYGADLEERRMTIRDHYVVAAVRPHETTVERDSHLGRLDDLPIVGWVVRAWVAPDPRAHRAAMADLLDHRLRRLEDGLRELDGCEAHRVDVADAMAVIGAFWAGEPLEQGDMEALLRTRPIVGGSE